METKAVGRVGNGGAVPAVAVEDFLRSVVCAVVAQTVGAAGDALVQLLLSCASCSREIDVVTENEDREERFNINAVRRNKSQTTAEVKDDGETDEDKDEDNEEDDQDEDGGEEEFSGDSSSENEGEDEDEIEEEDDEDDEEEDDDGDSDEDDEDDEEEEDDEDEEEE